MAKVEIDDEMVARAGAAWFGSKVQFEPELDGRQMRAVLEAALNPPPETLIQVTPIMVDAGELEWTKLWGGGRAIRQSMLPGIYRAMHAARPSILSPGNVMGYNRSDDHVCHAHRRKDDK